MASAAPLPGGVPKVKKPPRAKTDTEERLTAIRNGIKALKKDIKAQRKVERKVPALFSAAQSFVIATLAEHVQMAPHETKVITSSLTWRQSEL